MIGPNDHGKSNALLAIDCLNEGTPFDEVNVNDRFPMGEQASITYRLRLNESEIDQILLRIVERISLRGLGSNISEDIGGDSDDPVIGTPLKVNFKPEELPKLGASMKTNPYLEVMKELGKPQLTLKHNHEVPEYVRSKYEEEIEKRIPKVIGTRQKSRRDAIS